MRECPQQLYSERLEQRLLLADAFHTFVAEQHLIVTGTLGNDVILVELTPDRHVRVLINGKVSLHAGVTNLMVDGGNGDDFIHNRTDLPSSLYGSDGNDTIIGGDAADWMFGGAGDDVLHWSPHTNYFDGGSGIDRADFSRAPVGITMVGEDDTPWPERPFARMATVLSNDRPPGDFGVLNYLSAANIEHIRGTEFDDGFVFFIFFDTFFDVTIWGGSGNDGLQGPGSDRVVMYGEDGDDNFAANGSVGDQMTCYGGAGDDTFAVSLTTLGTLTQIFPGPGNNYLDLGESGFGYTFQLEPWMPQNVINVRSDFGFVTTIIGDERPNLISTELGNAPGYATEFPVHFIGGGGDDTLIGGYGNDTLEGGAGSDLLRGRPQFPQNPFPFDFDSDLILGGDGDDTAFGGPGNDTLIGGDGNDLIFAGAGDDSVDGGDGNDTLVAGPGANVLLGGAGDDWLIAFADKFPDTLDGGTGFDRVILRGPVGADVFQNVELILPAERSRLVVDLLGVGSRQ